VTTGSNNNNKDKWKPGRVLLNRNKRDRNIKVNPIDLHYWTPLTDQVEESEQKEDLINNSDENGGTAAFDTGGTSSCGKTGDNFEPSNEVSGKTFYQPGGATLQASTKAKLKHDVREPAKTVDMVPGLKNNSLISGPKFADAGYITVLTPTELLIYDGIDLQMTVNKDAFIKGWRDAN